MIESKSVLSIASVNLSTKGRLSTGCEGLSTGVVSSFFSTGASVGMNGAKPSLVREWPG